MQTRLRKDVFFDVQVRYSTGDSFSGLRAPQHYELLRLTGRDDIGSVRTEELTKRFVRESRITARLEHPGVPIVYDHGIYDGELYLVMQLIDGSPVSTVIDEVERLPIGWVAAIGAQVCTVLSVAHAASLVHRDLNPAT